MSIDGERKALKSTRRHSKISFSTHVSTRFRLSNIRPHEGTTRLGAMMSGLDIHYDLGEGHPLLGRRMPDLDLVTDHGPLRLFTLLHNARPVLLDLGEPGSFDIVPWADRVQQINAESTGPWELPALGPVMLRPPCSSAPTDMWPG